MESTIRVSIATMPFTMEQRAYRVLEDYLSNLKLHLGDDATADEIIKDVEYRISELFQLRLENDAEILSLNDIDAVLEIMGEPKEFGEKGMSGSDEQREERREGEESRGGDGRRQIREKRLYRDKSSRVLGGVCSGLSHYLRIDVVVVRLLFLLPFTLGAFVNMFGGVSGVAALIYLAMWLVVPEARSFEQKVDMMGADKANRAKDSSFLGDRKYRGSGFREILGVIAKVFLFVVIGFTIIIFLALLISGIWALYMDHHALYIDNYFYLLGLHTTPLKIAILMVVILPIAAFVGIIYRLLRRDAFKGRGLTLFFIGLAIWIGAGLYITSVATKFNVNKYYKEEVEQVQVNTQYDTLYVQLAPEYERAMNQPPDVDNLLYRELGKGKGNEVAIVMPVSIDEEQGIDAFEVKIIKKHRGVGRRAGRDLLSSNSSQKGVDIEYIVEDSVLTISPKWHGMDAPWDLSQSRVYIKVPEGKVVKLQGYLDYLDNTRSVSYEWEEREYEWKEREYEWKEREYEWD